MGLVRTPPEERDRAAIDASCKECDALFALLPSLVMLAASAVSLVNGVWLSKPINDQVPEER